eukprot:657733-Hanusia_phi.AAC.1
MNVLGSKVSHSRHNFSPLLSDLPNSSTPSIMFIRTMLPPPTSCIQHEPLLQPRTTSPRVSLRGCLMIAATKRRRG